MIYFMLPDFSRPAGGIRFSYAVVDALNAAGFDAAIWHGAGDFRCRWFENSTRIANFSRLTLNEGDVLVVPEWGGPRFASQTTRAAVVMFVQNHFHVFTDVDAFADVPGSYPGWPNAVGAVATSKAAFSFMERSIVDDMPLHLVPYPIDTELFKPGRKEKVIAFMPRKRGGDLAAVVQLLRRSPVLSGWRFEQIDGLSEAETAAVMARAAIFLSGSDREGFGLPPAEAMAAGCHVVGFTGDGGREFMRPDFCSVVEDQDLVGFVGAVESVARDWESDRPALEAKASAGRAFISDVYSQHAMRKHLEAAFGSLTAAGSPALQTERVEVSHYPTNGRQSFRQVVIRWIPPALVDVSRNIRGYARYR